jgi:hypothetical protein
VTKTDELLISSKIDEIAERYRAEGYQVRFRSDADPHFFDLVAEKNGRKVAVAVTTQGEIGKLAAELRNRQQLSAQHGYAETRVVVARPPRKTHVEIERLDQALFDYMSAHGTTIFGRLPTPVTVLDATNLEIESIELASTGVRVRGQGVVDVEIESPSSTLGEEWDFPFSFDVGLASDLTIRQVHSLNVDTADYES